MAEIDHPNTAPDKALDTTLDTTTAMPLDGAYDEAMALLLDAKDFAKLYREMGEDLKPEQRLRLSHYTMQVTARLTQIMAWLMASKAVAAGELPADALRGDDYALPTDGAMSGGDAEAMAREQADREFTPDRLANLMDQSRALYLRISRLDQEMRD
ncbi:MAG: DUF1465 family protein [Pseudomonadota bacterium]